MCDAFRDIWDHADMNIHDILLLDRHNVSIITIKKENIHIGVYIELEFRLDTQLVSLLP